MGEDGGAAEAAEPSTPAPATSAAECSSEVAPTTTSKYTTAGNSSSNDGTVLPSADGAPVAVPGSCMKRRPSAKDIHQAEHAGSATPPEFRRKVSFSADHPMTHRYPPAPSEGQAAHAEAIAAIQRLRAKRARADEPSMAGRLFRWLRALLRIVALWHVFAVVVILLSPRELQGLLVYLNFLRTPLFMDFEQPESVGLMGARHFYLHAADGVRLGGWHVLPSDAAASLLATERPAGGADQAQWHRQFDELLTADGDRVLLYLHGNAASRAIEHRVNLYKLFAGYFNTHVISIDYRGFGDSDGWPDEDGVARDARAAWDWLTVERGIPRERIFVYGHSLGGAISARLVQELSLEGAAPAGLVLEATFFNLAHAAIHHPVTFVLRVLPFMATVLQQSLVERFPSNERIVDITCPVMIMHGTADNVIIHDQGEQLFAALQQDGRNADVSFVSFDGASHNSIHRHPEVFRVLSDFFAKYDVHQSKRLF